MRIDYGRMTRLAKRTMELVSDPEVKPHVKRAYMDRAKLAIEEYLSADAAIAGVESAEHKDARQAQGLLAALDRPYREVRAALVEHRVDAALSETLSAQATDTDRKNAVERLLDVLDDHADQPWADALLAGSVVASLAAALAELDQAIMASSALAAARDRRARAFGVAHERYYAFKTVVRHAYGATSPQYRRIHVRADGSAGDERTRPTVRAPPE